jgi:Secretion system C-terminal sorting domain
MREVIVMLFIGVIFSVVALAQVKEQLPAMKSMVPKSDIICYAKPEDQNTIVPPPAAYLQWKSNKSARTNATTFQVEYVDFPIDAKEAFQKAVDIWSTLLETEVPIRIRAVWRVIEDGAGSSNNVLGSASPGTFIRDFDGAQQALTWYPVALAEKMAGEELNDADGIDIFAQFNSNYPNWNFATNGLIQVGKIDFVTLVLHEIGHGLGITRGYNVTGNNGEISSFFDDLHVVYDHFIENGNEKNLVQTFVPPSPDLKTELTSGALFFRTPQLTKISGGADNRAVLFAPSTFQSGSSVAHLDENTYNGSSNALMTPQIGTAEVVHDPGAIVKKMLADMGWVHTQILHTRLKNTETIPNPFEVKITLAPDKLNGYNYTASEVKLNHTTNGTTFTTVPMTATANPNEFSAIIPSTGVATTYGYYISVKDNLNRSIFKPGLRTEDGKAPRNLFFTFEAGPDTKAPFINHTPQPFILSSDTELNIEAILSDNIGILSATVDYQINGVDQVPVSLVLDANTDSTYTATIPLPVLKNGDKVKYRLRVKDSSVAQNLTTKPSASGFYELNVVSLAATQDSYTNDFNAITEDFFGDNLFSITTASGFSNGAIHTSHPYPNGTGEEFKSNFVYQLRIPIRLKSANATIKFDEIVLVEPGETGSKFGDKDFFDYVVVEGSKDGGVTWTPLADGYDSRDQAVWLTKFNSSKDGAAQPNSTAAGDPTLFKPRTINMLDKFAPGNEIVVRFRLLADQLVHGWGWAIDNLRIQIDDTPPTILHDHIDIFNTVTSVLPITSTVTDDGGVDKLFIDYKINSGTITTEELPMTATVEQYTLNLGINGLEPGDVVEYRIRSRDVSGNEGTLPTENFFRVPVINMGAPVAQYLSDFNSANTDFVGNFFSISQPTGFSNGAIHTAHPYPNGFGLVASTSNYVYMLTKPITISASNPHIIFDEIAIVEYTGSAVKDLVVVEGSKNNGTKWEIFLEPYSALANANWQSAFDNGTSGTSSLYKSRLINLTASGKFMAGDNVLIRFRLTADGLKNGWGWSIDNLSIQGPVTGIEKKAGSMLEIYPNPVTNGVLTVELARNGSNSPATVHIVNSLGQTMISDQIELVEGTNKKVFTVGSWHDGIYFLIVDFGDGTRLARKFIK